MKDGCSCAALTLATASRSVAVTSLFASLLNPMWLSLICTKRRPPSARMPLCAARSIDIPFRTPFVIVHAAPVPTHAMHFRNPRRSHSESACLFAINPPPCTGKDWGGGANIPGGVPGIKWTRTESYNRSMPDRRFEEVVSPHLDAAFNYARWLTKNEADAEDVVQDA